MTSSVSVQDALRVAQIIERNKILTWRPYPKQRAFMDAGSQFKERIIMAGNQQGKSDVGAQEGAHHLTGLYPSDWKGKRFDHPVKMWIAGVNGKKVRDNPQEKLFGSRTAWGVNCRIPASAIVGDPIMAHGTSGLIDKIQVRHISGGISTAQFYTYDQAVDAWASDSVHVIWCDEEPPFGHYMEALARLTATDGIIYMTFTPLLGVSEVVRLFYPHPTTSERWTIRMGIADAEHIPPERRQAIIDQYPWYERDARAFGKPKLGEGAVYQVDPGLIEIDPQPIPDYWRKIVGLDIGGGNHPTAAVWCAQEPNSKVWYLYDCYRVTNAQIAVHAAAIRARGARLPVAWPHDGHTKSRESGTPYREIYRRAGLNMLHRHAQHQDGTNSQQPAIDEITELFQTQQLRVFRGSRMAPWWEEYETYHRKDGKIVAEHDDLMKATQYAMMMRKHASTGKATAEQRKVLEDYIYDPFKEE